MNEEISEEVFISFFLNTLKNRNYIFKEYKNSSTKNNYTYRLQELAKENESILRQFFSCPTYFNFRRSKKIESPFYFMPYTAEDKKIMCRSTGNGQSHIYARQRLYTDIVEENNLYIRLSTRIYDGDICFNNSEILNIEKVNYYVFFYETPLSQLYFLILDIKKLFNCYDSIMNTLKQHTVITKNGPFVLDLYSFDIAELFSKGVLEILIKGTEYCLSQPTEVYYELSKKFKILDKEEYCPKMPENAFLLPDRPTRKIYYFYNVGKNKGQELTIHEFADFVCSKKSELKKKSVISELYRVARKQQELRVLGEEITPYTVLGQQFYIFENRAEFEKGISIEKKEEIENRIQNRENYNLIYKGKYTKKDTIKKWLKRHNNEFKTGWTEEEKTIAEEILKKWNSK